MALPPYINPMQAFLQGAQASSGYLSDLMRRRQAQQQMEQQQEMLPFKRQLLEAQAAHARSLAQDPIEKQIQQIQKLRGIAGEGSDRSEGAKIILQGLMRKLGGNPGFQSAVGKTMSDLENIKSMYGEDSSQYKQAQQLAIKKGVSVTSPDGTTITMGGTGVDDAPKLKVDQKPIYDENKRMIGYQEPQSSDMRKESGGQAMFNHIQPFINEALSYYSGEGSIGRGSADAKNYAIDPDARERIHKALAAKKLITALSSAEMQTLMAPRTKEIIKSLSQSFDDSDIPSLLQGIGKSYFLPKEAAKIAGDMHRQFIKDAREEYDIAARKPHKHYFVGHEPAYKYDFSLPSNREEAKRIFSLWPKAKKEAYRRKLKAEGMR